PYWTEEKQGGEFALLTNIVVGPREPPVARALRRRGVALPAAFDAWFARVAAAQIADREEHASAAVAALAETLGIRSPAASLPPVDRRATNRALAAAALASAASYAPTYTGGTGKAVVEDRTGPTGAVPASRGWGMAIVRAGGFGCLGAVVLFVALLIY